MYNNSHWVAVKNYKIKLSTQNINNGTEEVNGSNLVQERKEKKTLIPLSSE